MSKTTIKTKMVKKGHKLVRGTKKHSPLILLGLGIASGIGAGVMAYKSRPKMEAIVEDIEVAREAGDPVDTVEVGKRVTKALMPTIALSAISIGSFIWSYKIQNNRITALSGVLAATQAAHAKLQRKVRDKLGDEGYKELMTTDKVVTSNADEEGAEIEALSLMKAEYDKAIGEWYENSSEYFSDNHAYNMQWIYDRVDKIDLKLFSKGAITLNELRDALGFDRIASGAMVGWNSSDYFRVETMVYNETDPVTGEIKPYIWVTWTAPHYIYNDIEYDN